MKRQELRDELGVAAEEHELVQLRRRKDPFTLYGFVLGVEKTWVLLNYLADGHFLDGYLATRLSYVRSLRRLGPDRVMMEGLRLFGEVAQPVPGIDLSSTRALLTMAGAAFPIVNIQVEDLDPDVCYIGKVEAVTRRHVDLLEIDPSGNWYSHLNRWKLADITRVEFGGRYEAALVSVAGPPPEGPRDVWWGWEVSPVDSDDAQRQRREQ